LKIINKTQLNLGSLLINNVNTEDLVLNKFNSKPCNKMSCKVCIYFKSEPFIPLKNFLLPIDSNTSCSSKSVIYIINCKRCINTYYVGETDRSVSIRIREHLRDINNFIPYIQYNSVVSNHFNLLGHKVQSDFGFYVVISNIKDLLIRRKMETNFIHLLLNSNMNVLNDKIENKYKGLMI
jgi:hypothetical protein